MLKKKCCYSKMLTMYLSMKVKSKSQGYVLKQNWTLVGVTTMDACKNDYNLLALAAGSGAVMIYDQRKGGVVRKFNSVHQGTDSFILQSITFERWR